MTADSRYHPFDEATLKNRVAGAGLALDGVDIAQLMPLVDDLLGMSSQLSAYMGPITDRNPIYTVDKTESNGISG
ncbi:MAG: hypothetical protein WBQ44_05865 [Rhodococcus sp. (in: high G+C Gram-positive bacteria)]